MTDFYTLWTDALPCEKLAELGRQTFGNIVNIYKRFHPNLKYSVENLGEHSIGRKGI